MKKIIFSSIILIFNAQLIFAAGGEDCATAVSISSLPFCDTGNTTGAINNYTSCGNNTAPDHVYVYVPTADEYINVSTCANSCGTTTYDSRLVIYKNDCLAGSQIACNDDYCGLQSQLDNILFEVGNTYYIVVDGYNALFGPYAVHVYASPPSCSTTNALGCSCPDSSATNCDLLPDITAAQKRLDTQQWVEYSQNGNGANDGRLRLTVSTPNIGLGAFEVRGSSLYVCDEDTFVTYPGVCPDGSEPRQLLFQRIYHKNGGTMTFYDRMAGSMTYHPAHGHQHVDDWGFYTLRTKDPCEPNPLNWEIIGDGAKLGFCLLDLSNCVSSNGDCVDSSGQILNQPADFPNWGLGGGNYSCSQTVQGISSGYVDIYSYALDGMWIDLPTGLCNGEYWIVVQIDPHNYFMESDEENNIITGPITLTQQDPPINPLSEITVSDSLFNGTFCSGHSITLTANAGTEYTWSTGDTCRSITVDQPGNYFVTVVTPCGTALSQTLTIIQLEPEVSSVIPAFVCDEGTVTLIANGNGIMNWYDVPVGGNLVHTGNSFTTPILTQTTNYFVEAIIDSNNVICNSARTMVTATVNPLPSVSYTGLNPFYNENDPAIMLTGNPANGIFSGPGISGSSFDPMIATEGGPYTIIYSYTDGNNCMNTHSSTVTVGPPVAVSFSGLNLEYCIDGNYSVLNGNPANGTFSGTGIVGNIFDPSLAGVGTHGVTYTFDNNGNMLTYTLQTTVYNLPTLSIVGLNNDYCINDASVTLTGSPLGGTFFDNNLVITYFNPNTAGVGYHLIRYEYTDVHGCTNSVQQGVLVNNLPFVSFSGLQISYCENEPADELIGNPVGGSFSGNGISIFEFNPALAGVGGPYPVSYTYTDPVSGCTNSTISETIVHASPVVDFIGLNSTYAITDQPAQLTGNPFGGTFSGTGVQNDKFDPALAGAGNHIVTYTYTDANGCSGSYQQAAYVSDNTSVIDPLSNTWVSIYPNPSSGNFTLEISDKDLQSLELKLMSLTGQIILSENFEALSGTLTEQINADEISSGVYLLYLNSNEGLIVRKVVVE